MGLTIHYKLTHLEADGDTARGIVEQLQARAKTLGFAMVTEVFHETEDDEHDDTLGAIYPGRIIVDTGRECPPRDADEPPAPPREPMTDEEIEAAAHEMVEHWEAKDAEREAREAMGLPPEDDEDSQAAFSAELIDMSDGCWLDLHPLESYFFFASNPGSEPVLLGLARYPAVVEHTVKGVPDQFETGRGVGWHWEHFTKTQYAALPKEGGEANFLKTHLGIVELLDLAGSLGVGLEVYDEGYYWESRDRQKLLDQLGMYNSLVAGIAGRLKDSDLDFESPILGHPEFEHLEAKGDAALEEYRKRAEQRQDEEQ